MPLIRAIRTFNSVESGATSSAALETLLADVGRQNDLGALLTQPSYVRRLQATPSIFSTIIGSARGLSVAARSQALNLAAYSSSALRGIVTLSRSTVLAFSDLSAGAAGLRWWALPRRTLPSAVAWTSVAYGNGLFVAIARSTTVYATSTDGINWTTRALPSNQTWSSIAFGGGTFVVLSGGNSTGSSALTSTDGINWTARSLPSSFSWNAVAYGGGMFVAVSWSTDGGTTPSNAFATSPDGVTWTSRAPGSSDFWASVTYGSGLFVAIAGVQGGSNKVATSPDGINWTIRTIDANGYNWSSITFGNGSFVAVSRNQQAVATSSDGISWTVRAVALPSSLQWTSVAFGAGAFVALSGSTLAGSGGSATAAVSLDGITWTALTLQDSATWSCVAYGAGVFVGVSGGYSTTSSVAFTHA